MALTTQMRTLLGEIVNDKYQKGPFSGMLFNAKIAHPDATIEYLIEEALTVRLKMEDLAL